MTPYLIIDGYNLMHAAGIAKTRYAPGGLEACRARLHRELSARLDDDVLATAVVVYDAFDSISNLDRQQQHRGLNVLFAAQGRDADSLIERMLRQHSVPRRVIVVSSDHRLHKAAKRRRARCVDSEDFWSELEADTRLHANSGRPQPQNSGDSSIEQNPTVDFMNEFLSKSLPDQVLGNVPAVRGAQETLEEELQRWAATAEQEEIAAEHKAARRQAARRQAADLKAAAEHKAAAARKAVPASQNPVATAQNRSSQTQKRLTPARRRAEAAQDDSQADIPGERAQFSSEFADDYLRKLHDDLRHDRLQ